jgi:hypothetical protein
MLQAVKYGHMSTWPGLTEDAVNNHLKLTPATTMGHMNQRRQNIRTTSKAPIDKQQSPDIELVTKTHLVYAVVVDLGQLYTDLTVKFLVRSSKGNSYVMVCYITYCNYVKFFAMNSRYASEWVKAYDIIHQELTIKGFKPKLQTLNTEAYAALQTFLTANDIAYQLVPPHCHRHNAAKRAIRTFQKRFVAGLSSFDPSFQMHLWDRLLPQVEITLKISCRPLDCFHSSLPMRTTMVSWITTNQFLLRQDAKLFTRETRKSANLGSSRAAWILTWSHGQRTHHG